MPECTVPPVVAASGRPRAEGSAPLRGLWLGVLGVCLFALTLPMTRLAVGPADAPQLPPTFVTFGRAALAAAFSLVWLLATRAARPPRRLWPALAVCAAGTVLGFPLFLGFALRHVDAVHAAVVTGLLPLATAAVAALALRQRAPMAFWACAVAGAGLVLAFAGWQGGGWRAADGLLGLAVLSAAAGYVAGARATATLGAEAVICWVLVLAAPLTVPLALAAWPSQPAAVAAWAGFGYVTLFSMWLGFFAWYRGLALGGTLRVSQVQLLQPFLTMLFAVPLLGERIDATTLAFALAVLATVLVGRRVPMR